MIHPRLLAAVLLVVALVGCDAGPNGPAGPLLVVRVFDDRGGTVDRMPILVALSSGRRIDMVTRRDGTARMRVEELGTHRVTVIPRAGYLGTRGTMTREVTLGLVAGDTVDFTVHREELISPSPEPPAN